MSAPAPADRFPPRLQLVIYAIAFFAGNGFIMVGVIMPLWALELTDSLLLIGIVISSRQLLVVFLAIHGGALIDRFGPRRVLVSLALAGAVLTLLFPVLPFLWAVILLQMLTGIAESVGWIGAQALVGSHLKGNPVMAGRMTAVTRIGGFFGPWLIGLSWQYGGPEGAFLMLAAWTACGALAALGLPADPGTIPRPGRRISSGHGASIPAAEVAEIPAAGPVAEPGRRKADVLPRLSDYAATLRTFLIPAVALVMAVTFIRQTGSGVQSSFYGVWLKESGISAGTIGLLFGIANAASAAAALTIGPLTRLFADYLLLIGVTVIAILAIALTPALDGFLLLAVAIAIRGCGQGLNLPLMLSISSRAVGPELQGRIVALRHTFNRLGGALVPFLMGAVAEVVGLENAFYLIGILGAALLIGLGLWASRAPAFRDRKPGRLS